MCTVKETTTVEEYRQLRIRIERIAKAHYEEHKRAFENWNEGDIDKIWIDRDGYICIQYQSGNWWHYRENGDWW
jgi:hypothetical protein